MSLVTPFILLIDLFLSRRMEKWVIKGKEDRPECLHMGEYTYFIKYI